MMMNKNTDKSEAKQQIKKKTHVSKHDKIKSLTIVYISVVLFQKRSRRGLLATCTQHSCYYAVWCAQCGLFHNNKYKYYFIFLSLSLNILHEFSLLLLVPCSFFSFSWFNHLVELFDLINDFDVKHSFDGKWIKINSIFLARLFLWVLFWYKLNDVVK